MKKLINVTTLLLIILSAPAMAQTGVNPNEAKSNEEVKSGTVTNIHSVNYKKPLVKVPPVIAPAQSTTGAANCADQLGKGNTNYTACEAGQKNR